MSFPRYASMITCLSWMFNVTFRNILFVCK